MPPTCGLRTMRPTPRLLVFKVYVAACVRLQHTYGLTCAHTCTHSYLGHARACLHVHMHEHTHVCAHTHACTRHPGREGGHQWGAGGPPEGAHPAAAAHPAAGPRAYYEPVEPSTWRPAEEGSDGCWDMYRRCALRVCLLWACAVRRALQAGARACVLKSSSKCSCAGFRRACRM